MPPPTAAKTSPTTWVLLGCGGCLTLVVIGALCFAGFFWLVMGVVKDSDVYTEANRKMQASPEVQEVLGAPVEPGWMFQGSVAIKNGAGTADFSVPVSGPKGSGTLVAKATKKAGGLWQYSVLEVQVDEGGTIDLKDVPKSP